MTTGPSRKELRRQAALRERERRSGANETANLKRASGLHWGSASLLSDEIRFNMTRIGAAPRNPCSNDAVEILTREIKWPTSKFRASSKLFRTLNPNDVVEAMDEVGLQDAMPVRCFDYTFADPEEVEEIHGFLNLKDRSLRVIGLDIHHYFLIGPNPSQAKDPLLYRIDHAGMDEPADRSENVTIGWLLSVLATA